MSELVIIDDPDERDFITKLTYSGIRVTEVAEDGYATYSVEVDAYPKTPCRKGCVRIGIHIYGGWHDSYTVMMNNHMPLKAVPKSLYQAKLFCKELHSYIGENADPAAHINRVLGLMLGPFMKLQITGIKDKSGTGKVRFDLTLNEKTKTSTTVELATFKGLYELE